MKVLNYFKNLVLGILIGVACSVFVLLFAVLLSFMILVSGIVSGIQGKDVNFKDMSLKLEDAATQLKKK